MKNFEEHVPAVLAAYLSGHQIRPDQIVEAASEIRRALAGPDYVQPEPEAPVYAGRTPPRTLTSKEIKDSIKPSHLVSFEDGKSYKTIRRHLTTLGLTPETYRAKWGLPMDYPMTCTDYSAQRSQLAKDIGLGKGGKAAEATE